MLSSIPQLKALFRENADKQTKLDAFVGCDQPAVPFFLPTDRWC